MDFERVATAPGIAPSSAWTKLAACLGAAAARQKDRPLARVQDRDIRVSRTIGGQLAETGGDPVPSHAKSANGRVSQDRRLPASDLAEFGLCECPPSPFRSRTC
jgi:hypothetical protein